MNYKKYLDIRSNLIKDNRLLKSVIMMLAIATVISSVASYRALNHSRTIIVPAGANRPFEVSDTRMDENGVKMFTRQVFDLGLNYSPTSAKERFSDLLSMVHTRYYDKLKDELDKQLATIDRMNIVSTYIVENIRLNATDKKVKVRGQRRRTTFGKEMDDGIEEWTLDYEIMDSNFKIIKIQKT
jgi:type IV conjugative transfer system protein TraE